MVFCVISTICISSSAPGLGTIRVEHKAVHLRLRQRVGTVLLNGVLRRQHEEGPFIFRDTPMTVTVCSCIASSSADCVLGVARLISSASTILLNTGPGWNWKLEFPFSSLTIMLVPVTSAGIVSG